MESFLGYMNYHRTHVKGYAGITACLYELVKPRSVFLWTDCHQEAFERLKERTVAYASLVLIPAHRRYCTTRKKLLAVVRFCRHFRHYLLGRPFIIRTDHNSLAWLMRFRHIEGQLYYLNRSENEEDCPCLVVPAPLQGEVLKLCHDVKTSGHLGRDKTLERLKRAFFWYHMSRDSQVYIMSCEVCNRNKKPSRKQKARLGCYHAGYPMERVHLDILGGPFTTSEDGNSYILMMYDQFSKWLECEALPVQSAELIAKKFVTKFIATFGCPLEVHTDQGQKILSRTCLKLCAPP